MLLIAMGSKVSVSYIMGVKQYVTLLSSHSIKTIILIEQSEFRGCYCQFCIIKSLISFVIIVLDKLHKQKTLIDKCYGVQCT